MRADSLGHVPSIRMTNLHLEPGAGSLEDPARRRRRRPLPLHQQELVDRRQAAQLQFGTQVAWEIKKGKLGRMLRDATYMGVTPEFWGRLDAVAGPDEWTSMYGLTNCGKGQPGQHAHVSHGVAGTLP